MPTAPVALASLAATGSTYARSSFRVMVIEAETQVFGVPNDCLSLSADCALPCYLMDDEESFLSADAHRSLYPVSHRTLSQVQEGLLTGGTRSRMSRRRTRSRVVATVRRGGLPRPRAVGSPTGGTQLQALAPASDLSQLYFAVRGPQGRTSSQTLIHSESVHDIACRLDLSAWGFQLVDDIAPADAAPDAAPNDAASDDEDGNEGVRVKGAE